MAFLLLSRRLRRRPSIRQAMRQRWIYAVNRVMLDNPQYSARYTDILHPITSNNIIISCQSVRYNTDIEKSQFHQKFKRRVIKLTFSRISLPRPHEY